MAMTIILYNTLTKKKEPFVPIDDTNVRMYVCGPTVYDRAHLGNARPVLVFDVLYRLLCHIYGKDHVKYVSNFTDVDDKINATALARKKAGASGSLEELVAERTDETISWYHADMDALGALRPDCEPRATEYIAQMVAMNCSLINDGYAYEVDGHVLFRVRNYSEYGALSGRSVDDMLAGARVEVAPYKEDSLDFVLWKPSSDELPGWNSPWGRGRPGWHIECSAMAYELLGDNFDIHGGGNDLQFPHHENEIAQSKCAGHDFANVWLHNEMLQIDGKKMSKSLGNFFTVRDLLDQGVAGEVIRFVMLSTHYRKPMNWTEKKQVEAEKTLNRWLDQTVGLIPTDSTSFIPNKGLIDSLSEDINTHKALSYINSSFQDNSQALLDHARWFGFLGDGTREDHVARQLANDEGYGGPEHLASLVAQLDALRRLASKSKDFSEVDTFKAQLIQAGLEVRMLKDKSELIVGENFNPKKL